MEVTAQITSMDHPIGRLLGNAHEVSVACLKGEGPEDTMELVRMQGAALGADVDAVIADGSALDAFAQMCRRHGVDGPVRPSCQPHGPSCRAAVTHHARRTLQRMDQRH